MRKEGVINIVMNEREKWGIDEINGMVRKKRDIGWKEDKILRMESIVKKDDVSMEEMGKSMKM